MPWCVRGWFEERTGRCAVAPAALLADLLSRSLFIGWNFVDESASGTSSPRRPCEGLRTLPPEFAASSRCFCSFAVCRMMYASLSHRRSHGFMSCCSLIGSPVCSIAVPKRERRC